MTADRRSLTTGRRVYRAVAFALMVGLVSAGMAIVPALFVQSIFIGNEQRCQAQQQMELAQFDEVRTTCDQDLSSTPTWLPPWIIAGGGVMGILGGAGYGFAAPRPVASSWSEREEKPWLPF